MILFLTIFQYFVGAIVDVLDKVLISTKKIKPFQYAFYTVVTGAVVVLAWPFVFARLPGNAILWSLLSGAYFCLTIYVFMKALSGGEASRVIPFVFGLVPVFDILLSWLTGKNGLSVEEFAAVCLLIPGALIISHRRGKFFGKHVAIKLSSSFLWSSYFFLWQYASNTAVSLSGDANAFSSSFMWNRIGAAALFILLLALPPARQRVFTHEHIQTKKQTSWLFIFKQLIGGGNFILLSWITSVGKLPVINAMQGFRYVFLFAIALFMTKKYRHILEEDADRHTLNQKLFALALIFIGTLILFLS